MALKSATTTLATIQMRRGAEENFDPDQMTAGEWAVSTDSKKVWMCFRPGLVLRMATYEAFEKDMEEIRAILLEAKDIEKAIVLWSKLAESYAHGGTGEREGEDTDNAKYYSEQAKISADKAESLADIGIMTTEKAGIGKPDGTTITADEDGTMHAIGGGGSADTGVTGVKGDKEENYRSGNVNLTPENIGALPADGNAVSATKATQDGNGNNIADTYALKSIYGDTAVSMGRKEGTAVGDRSIAYGYGVDASKEGSVALGNLCKSNGIRGFSIGNRNTSSGANSFSGGFNNTSQGGDSFCFGVDLYAAGDYANAEGTGGIALGYASHVENSQNIAGAKYVLDVSVNSSSERTLNALVRYLPITINEVLGNIETGSLIFVTNGKYIDDANVFTVESVDVANKTITVKEDFPPDFSPVHAVPIISGNSAAHSEGRESMACGRYSHVEGYRNISYGDSSHAGGYWYNLAMGKGSFAHGEGCSAHGNYGVSMGDSLSNFGYSSFACGKYGNLQQENSGNNNTNGTAFIVGGGYYDGTGHLSNAFSVKYNGEVKAKSTITGSTTADYAEFFEWEDGNLSVEDRVGKFVTISGNKIKIANSGDYIVGIISGAPFVLGNGDIDEWNWKYLRDEFRRVIYEPAPKIEEDQETRKRKVCVDENGNIVYFGKKPKINPEYDESMEYVSRADRPEWDAVGMIGVLSVRDDGTCEVGRYCRCADGGIATLAEERGFDTYMVIERISENIVSVILK